MKLDPQTIQSLLDLAREKNVHLEGNILKLLPPEDYEHPFSSYLQEARDKDTSTRQKRLEITRQIQSQNIQLQLTQQQLESALHDAQNAKTLAEQDLSILQKKSQFHLIRRITNLALATITLVGISSTITYLYALAHHTATEQIVNTWSSLTGILLSNSFSILATIMGIKYASDKPTDK